MSEHRKWEPGVWDQSELHGLRAEHNALHTAWKDTMAELDRMCKANNEACDRIHELESRPVLTWEECDAKLQEICGYCPKPNEREYLNWLKSRLPAPTDSIRVPFSDAQIERMGAAFWKDYRVGTDSARCIRAALAAGGIEPCPSPEYDPAEVKWNEPTDAQVEALARALHDAYRNECRLGPADTAPNAGYIAEARAAFAHLRPTQGHVLRDRLVEAQTKIENQRVELARLNKLVAELREEIDEDNTNAANVNDLLVQVQNLTAERDGLQKRNDVQGSQLKEIDALISPLMTEVSQLKAELAAALQTIAVPVKVHWGVTPIEFGNACHIGLTQSRLQEFMDYLAKHAVIDVAGVPSVEELDQIGAKAFTKEGAAEGTPRSCRLTSIAAIRDAVLAGVAAERQAIPETGTTYRRNPANDGFVDMPTPAQVEALARALHDADESHSKRYYTWESRAESIHEDYKVTARAAIAHLSRRPEGLPTAEELAEIVHEVIMNPSLKSPVSPHIVEAILTALRPWLRDPVGWELDDVDAVELGKRIDHNRIEYLKHNQSEESYFKIMGETAIDYLTDERIRPVYECQDCAKLRQKLHYAAEAWRKIRNGEDIDALDFALEGE